jgi:hypothetical protein
MDQDLSTGKKSSPSGIKNMVTGIIILQMRNATTFYTHCIRLFMQLSVCARAVVDNGGVRTECQLRCECKMMRALENCLHCLFPHRQDSRYRAREQQTRFALKRTYLYTKYVWVQFCCSAQELIPERDDARPSWCVRGMDTREHTFVQK